MPPLPREFTTRDEIPEALREYYVEQNGRWILDSPGGKNDEDVRRALAARDNERNEAAKLRQQIESIRSRFGDISEDRLDQIMEVMKSDDDREHQRLLDEKRYEEAAQKKFERQIAEMNRQIESLKQVSSKSDDRYKELFEKFRQVKISEALTKEFLGAGGDPEFADMFLATVSPRWELDPETGDPIPIDWIDGGRTKITARGADGNPLTMQEHARTILRDRPRLMLPSNGANSTHQSSGGQNTGMFRMTRDEARTNPNKYAALSQQARAQGQEVTFTDS